jgi:hypothetical protein
MWPFRTRASVPPLPIPRIAWFEDEIGYGHRVRRAQRVFDGEGNALLDLCAPELDLRVATWFIVDGTVDEQGGVRVVVEGQSGPSNKKRFELRLEPGSRSWSHAGTPMDSSNMAQRLTRMARMGDAARIDIDAVVDAIKPSDDED